MGIIQTFRRLGQLLDDSWGKSMRNCDHQLVLINKLYQRNGLELKMTCPACPEQYEIFKDGNQIAYYRLRHGTFSVDFPDHMGKTILEIDTVGDGIFDEKERLVCLTKAMRSILKELEITSKASTKE